MKRMRNKNTVMADERKVCVHLNPRLLVAVDGVLQKSLKLSFV